MTAYYDDGRVTILHGDSLELLRDLPSDSVDAVVTDPPYGLEFMGKEWDRLDGTNWRNNSDADQKWIAQQGGKASLNARRRNAPDYGKPDSAMQEWHLGWAKECLRALKPGGHLLAFGGSRTWHRLAAGIEDAGFEIRDSIAWLYGSGFPKSHNLKDDWQGWGTALKPAFEPVVVARKPLIGTVADNVLQHGTGALNIDGCRVPTNDKLGGGHSTHGQQMSDGWRRPWMDNPAAVAANAARSQANVLKAEELGRWPANVVLDDFTAEILDEQSGERPGGQYPAKRGQAKSTSFASGQDTTGGPRSMGDTGGASRFFYVAKAPTKERPKVDGIAHPTVKPLTLMRWLVRLVTPPDGIVLEPFAGSGTTVEAAILEGFRVIAMERSDEYLPLIDARITRAKGTPLEQRIFPRQFGSDDEEAELANIQPDLFSDSEDGAA